MTKIIFIHCHSCGEDGNASWAVPRHGNPVMRCGKCRSLNFRVIESADVEDESPAEYGRLASAVQANVQEETMEVSDVGEKSI